METSTELETIEFTYRAYRPWIHRAVPGVGRYRITGFAQDHILRRIRSSRSFYERDLLEAVSMSLPEPPALVVDVGANIGNHTLFWANALGIDVLAVEASRRAAALLQRNVAQNDAAARVTVVECAAGHRDGTVVVQEAPIQNIGKTSVAESAEGAGGQEVPLRRLDEIVASARPSLPARVLVKIDVEGFEKQVLTGAEGLLSAHGPELILELANAEAQRWAREFLSPRGYGAFVQLPAATPTFLVSRGPLGQGTPWSVTLWRVGRRLGRG